VGLADEEGGIGGFEFTGPAQFMALLHPKDLDTFADPPNLDSCRGASGRARRLPTPLTQLPTPKEASLPPPGNLPPPPPPPPTPRLPPPLPSLPSSPSPSPRKPPSPPRASPGYAPAVPGLRSAGRLFLWDPARPRHCGTPRTARCSVRQRSSGSGRQPRPVPKGQPGTRAEHPSHGTPGVPPSPRPASGARGSPAGRLSAPRLELRGPPR